MWGVEYSLGGTFGSTFHLLKISCVLPNPTTRKQPRSLSLTFKHVKCPQETWIIFFSTSGVIQFHPENFLAMQCLHLLMYCLCTCAKYPMSQIKCSHVQNRQSDYRWVTAHLENVRELEWYICKDLFVWWDRNNTISASREYSF